MRALKAPSRCNVGARCSTATAPAPPPSAPPLPPQMKLRLRSSKKPVVSYVSEPSSRFSEPLRRPANGSPGPRRRRLAPGTDAAEGFSGSRVSSRDDAAADTLLNTDALEPSTAAQGRGAALSWRRPPPPLHCNSQGPQPNAPSNSESDYELFRNEIVHDVPSALLSLRATDEQASASTSGSSSSSSAVLNLTEPSRAVQPCRATIDADARMASRRLGHSQWLLRKLRAGNNLLLTIGSSAVIYRAVLALAGAAEQLHSTDGDTLQFQPVIRGHGTAAGSQAYSLFVGAQPGGGAAEQRPGGGGDAVGPSAAADAEKSASVTEASVDVPQQLPGGAPPAAAAAAPGRPLSPAVPNRYVQVSGLSDPFRVANLIVGNLQHQGATTIKAAGEAAVTAAIHALHHAQSRLPGIMQADCCIVVAPQMVRRTGNRHILLHLSLEAEAQERRQPLELSSPGQEPPASGRKVKRRDRVHKSEGWPAASEPQAHAPDPAPSPLFTVCKRHQCDNCLPAIQQLVSRGRLPSDDAAIAERIKALASLRTSHGIHLRLRRLLQQAPELLRFSAPVLASMTVALHSTMRLQPHPSSIPSADHGAASASTANSRVGSGFDTTSLVVAVEPLMDGSEGAKMRDLVACTASWLGVLQPLLGGAVPAALVRHLLLQAAAEVDGAWAATSPAPASVALLTDSQRQQVVGCITALASHFGAPGAARLLAALPSLVGHPHPEQLVERSQELRQSLHMHHAPMLQWLSLLCQQPRLLEMRPAQLKVIIGSLNILNIVGCR